MTSEAKIQPVFKGREEIRVAFWLFSSRSRVAHALRPILILWLVKKFNRWVHAQNLCSILNLVYFDSWSWQSFVSTCDVFNFLFPLDVAAIRSLLLFMASLFIGFLVEKYVALAKSESRFRMASFFVFHLAWCVRLLKSLKRFWPYLIVFSASRMVSLSSYCIWCLFFFYI